MARRLATTGYYVVLPNLYYRTTDHFELDLKPEAMLKDVYIDGWYWKPNGSSRYRSDTELPQIR